MAAISQEEKLRRREIVDSSIGTNAMSGVFLDAEASALFERFVEGEFSQSELSDAINSYVANLLRASGREVPSHLLPK
jgi:hypothetical protein